jgi:hypothetical protein
MRRIVAPLWLHPLTGNVVCRAAWVIVVISAVLAASYVLLPQYVDYVEAHVVVVAVDYLNGLPIHPDWTRGEGAYGVLYGPLVYEIIAASLLVSKSVATSKILPVLAYLLSIGAMVLIGAKSKARDRRETTLTYLALSAAAGYFSFCVRSDPLLVLTAALACLALMELKPKASACALGLLAGLATAMKIHAFMYFAPLAVELVLVRERNWRARAQLTALALAAFILGFGAPFAFSLSHLMAFEKYIRVTSRHGLSIRLLLLNLAAALAIMSPYLVRIAKPGAGSILIRYGLPALTIGAIVTVAVIGAKPGAGRHHLMPFIPVLLLLSLKKGYADANPARATLFLAAAVTVAIFQITHTAQKIVALAATAGDARLEQAEAVQLANAFPGSEFGPTDDIFSRSLTSRVAAAFQGARFKYDTAAWLDLSLAGVQPQDDQTLTGCTVRTWILPKDGEPFSAIDYYRPLLPLFSPAFQDHFKSSHRVVRTGRYYLVWACLR